MSYDNHAQLLALMSMIGKGRKNKAPKKQKKTYNNWFEKLKGDELKSLCRAANLPVSGTNAALCERLCQGELSAPYSYEYAPEKFSRSRFEYEFGSMSYGGYGSGGESNRGPPPKPAQQGSKRSTGYSNEDLKQMCKEKGLQVSGKRFDLVLRLLQNESGVGGAPKRVATDELGNPKKRAKSMTLPNVEKIEERVFKKFFPPDEVKHKWSNNKYKYHGQDCIVWSVKLLDKEVFDKELFERGEEKVAWNVINTVLYRLTEGNKEKRDAYYAEQRSKGYKLIMAIGGTHVEFVRCDWEMKRDFLPQIIKAIKATSSKEVVDELSGDILYAFHRQVREYMSEESVAPFTAVLNEYIPRKDGDGALANPEPQFKTIHQDKKSCIMTTNRV